MQPQYVGNNDFRGYLAYLAQGNGGPGDAMASNALQFTGNDGGLDQGYLRQQAAGPSGNQAQDESSFNALYNQYSKYVGDRWNEYNSRNTGGTTLGASTSRLGGGSTGGGSSYDPNDLAFIDSQIGSVNQGIGRLGNQRGIGLENILNSWQEAENKRQADKAVAERDYNTAKTDSTNQYLDSRSGIRRDAGNMYQSGRRALGAAGAGRSSALDVLLPFAVGKEAAMRFGETQDSFGKNQRGLDTSWSDTTRQYDEFGSDLTNKKRLKEQELEQGILGQEASLQDQLAQLQLQKSSLMGGNAAQALAGVAPIRDRISTILGQVDNLGKQYTGAVQPAGQVKFQAPELASYDYSKFAPVTAGQNQPALGDYVSPLTSIIQKRKELEK